MNYSTRIMKAVLLNMMLLLSLSSISQDCSKELLKQKPGTWKAGMQGSIVNVSAVDLAKEKST